MDLFIGQIGHKRPAGRGAEHGQSMSYLGSNPDTLRALHHLEVNHVGAVQNRQIYGLATLGGEAMQMGLNTALKFSVTEYQRG